MALRKTRRSPSWGGVPMILSSRFKEIFGDDLRVPLGRCVVGLLVGEHVEQGTRFAVR